MATTAATEVYTTLGTHRGSPRLWLQGSRLYYHGIRPGDTFDLQVDELRRRLIIVVSPRGERKISQKTVGRIRVPVVDVNNVLLTKAFGTGTRRLCAQFYRRRIVISIARSEIAAMERLDRILGRVAQGEALECGSLFSGACILDHALHQGFFMAGLDCKLAFVVEKDGRAVDAAVRNNALIRGSTKVVIGSVDEVDFRQQKRVDVLHLGIPCEGTSASGRAKRAALASAEAHPLVGHLFVTSLHAIKEANPAVVIIEQVDRYKAGAAMDAMRVALDHMGYVVHETILDGAEYGALERRKRLCVVAVTKGLEIDLARIVAVRSKEPTIADILEVSDPRVAPAHTFWSRFEHLVAKEDRDRQAYKLKGWGTGFPMQPVTSADSSVPTIPATYSRIQSTTPKLRHPEDRELMRQFSPREHAAVKAVPFDLVAGECPSKQHELLGQSITHPAWVAVGRHVGLQLIAAAGAHSVAAGHSIVAGQSDRPAPMRVQCKQLQLAL